MSGSRMDTRRWTPEDLLIIRRDYDQTHSSCQRMAIRFNVTTNAVSKIVTRLGLRRIRRIRWTRRDEERLRELISKHTVDEAVALFSKRTRCAVVMKAKKIKLSLRERSEWYTMMEVAELLGMDPNAAKARFNDGRLKAVPHDSTHPPRKGHSGVWHVSKEDLVDYIRTYPEDLVGRNVDIVTLIDILVGINYKYPG